MSVDVWLTRGIAHALAAAWQSQAAVRALTTDDDRAAAYLSGYAAALQTVALFFGVEPAAPIAAGQCRQIERR